MSHKTNRGTDTLSIKENGAANIDPRIAIVLCYDPTEDDATTHQLIHV